MLARHLEIIKAQRPPPDFVKMKENVESLEGKMMLSGGEKATDYGWREEALQPGGLRIGQYEEEVEGGKAGGGREDGSGGGRLNLF
jgi:hypothetical protein